MLVSIIIPCFNAEDYVRECINSALAQTYEHIEIICVDNNSTDGTLNVLNDYATKNPQKIIVISERMKGAAAARNKGLSVAKGDWIQFLDADDLILPEKIKTQIELQKDNDIDLIVGNCYFEKNGIRTEIRHHENAWVGLIEGKLGNTVANLWRMKMLIEVGGWEDIKSSQETNLMFKMMKQEVRIKYDDLFETIIKIRNPHSISNMDRKNNWVRYIELRVEIWNYLFKTDLITNQILFALKRNIFTSIRILYAYEPLFAIEMNKKYVRGKFNPERSLGISFLYIIVFKMFGFSLTQRLSNLISPVKDYGI